LTRRPQITKAVAARLAQIAMGHAGREYPNILVHGLTSPADARTPRGLHPTFYGSYDWHSCVHAHWLLARVLRLYPGMTGADAAREHFIQGFTPEKVATELEYFDRPQNSGFERPYGWAWLLMLAAELRRSEDKQAQGWEVVLRPLTESLSGRFKAFLPKADYPVRAGSHANTAFALTLVLEYGQVFNDRELCALAYRKAVGWYGADVACQAWEPSGDDFLSPALMEAELMRRLFSPAMFQAWFASFLPEAGLARPATLFSPARVSDRSDGKIAHLDGLNLSRAWCWRGISTALARDDPARALALQSADRHLAASLPHVSGEYMGEHWLASFALLALLA
jgi:Protein of unknown function (DUF2891)